MKYVFFIFMFFFLTACSTPPEPPQPTGEKIRVNSSHKIDRDVNSFEFNVF